MWSPGEREFLFMGARPYRIQSSFYPDVLTGLLATGRRVIYQPGRYSSCSWRVNRNEAEVVEFTSTRQQPSDFPRIRPYRKLRGQHVWLGPGHSILRMWRQNQRSIYSIVPFVLLFALNRPAGLLDWPSSKPASIRYTRQNIWWIDGRSTRSARPASKPFRA